MNTYKYKERATGNFYIDPDNYFKEQFEAIREACKKSYENDNIIDTEIDETLKIDKPIQSDSEQWHTMFVEDLKIKEQARKEREKEYNLLVIEYEKMKKELQDMIVEGKSKTLESEKIKLRQKYRKHFLEAKVIKDEIDRYETIFFNEELSTYHGRLLRSDFGFLKIIDHYYDITGKASLRLETEEKEKQYDKDFESKEAIMNYIKCYLV